MNQTAKLLCLSGMFTVSALTTGCASIVSGTNQPISVETRSNAGEIIAGANCKLENPKGTWYVTTPGSVTVHRAFDDLSIYCTKVGQQPGIAAAKSSTKGMAFGNLLFGGVIGAGVDVASGAAYDYPTLITVQLGGDATVQPPVREQAATPGTGTATIAPTGNSGMARVSASAGDQPVMIPVTAVGMKASSIQH